MTTKRYSVLLGHHPTGNTEPGTLVLDLASSHPETLAFQVFSTRGRGALLYQGETWAERRDPPGSYPLCPSGYEILRFDTNRESTDSFSFFTVVADEILAGAKALRRSKPRPKPATKFADDETWTCACCGLRVMSRGSDNPGWKGVQMSPSSPVYTYYCTKPKCVEARDQAIDQAKINWGYEDTSDAPPENDPPPEGPVEHQAPMGILTNRR